MVRVWTWGEVRGQFGRTCQGHYFYGTGAFTVDCSRIAMTDSITAHGVNENDVMGMESHGFVSRPKQMTCYDQFPVKP